MNLRVILPYHRSFCRASEVLPTIFLWPVTSDLYPTVLMRSSVGYKSLYMMVMLSVIVSDITWQWEGSLEVTISNTPWQNITKQLSVCSLSRITYPLGILNHVIHSLTTDDIAHQILEVEIDHAMWGLYVSNDRQCLSLQLSRCLYFLMTSSWGMMKLTNAVSTTIKNVLVAYKKTVRLLVLLLC